MKSAPKIWALAIVLPAFLFCGLLAFRTSTAAAQDFAAYVGGLAAPTCITSAQDGSGRLFICEKAGKIQIAKSGALLSTPFLDITSLVSTESERGLVSLAFHPEFRHNRKLYIFYVDTNHDINVAEYKVMLRNKNRVDHSSRRTIIRIRHRDFANHNGGQIAFGPDGYLYIGTGDGGSGGDPFKNGQNRRALLAKILRIDVNVPSGSKSSYLIPKSNPYASSTTGARKEIFAYGFRNPWRFSFDPVSKQLFAGDVGQDLIEEIDIVQRGKNYGWSITEGDDCYNAGSCNMAGLAAPIHTYAHDSNGGQSVTGGYVYRGRDVPSLYGKYIFGDFVSGRIWALTKSGDNWSSSLLHDTSFGLSTFGVDGRRELYAADYGSGTIYKMIQHVCGSSEPEEQVC